MYSLNSESPRLATPSFRVFGLLIGLLIIGDLCSATAVAATTPDQPQPGLDLSSEPAVRPRDPTRPPGAPDPLAGAGESEAESSLTRPVLTSILLGSQRRLAVINNKLVREGDLVAGMTLVRVGKDEVQLQGQNQNQSLVLRLPKSNIGKDYR